MTNTFIEIEKAEYIGGYRLRLWFNNGEVREMGLADKLIGEAYQPLHDKAFFQRFSIPFNTVEWENGADFAPEYLYEQSALLNGLDVSMPLPISAEESVGYVGGH